MNYESTTFVKLTPGNIYCEAIRISDNPLTLFLPFYMIDKQVLPCTIELYFLAWGVREKGLESPYPFENHFLLAYKFLIIIRFPTKNSRF